MVTDQLHTEIRIYMNNYTHNGRKHKCYEIA